MQVHAMVMGGLEKESESLQLAEYNKSGLRKSIHSLMVQWKDLEGQLDLARKGLSEGLRELDSKEKKLNSEKESLKLNWELLEQRFKEVRDREKDFSLFRDKKIRDLELTEDEFVRIRETYAREVSVQLKEQEKRVEELLAALKLEKLQVEGLKNFVEKRFEEMGLKEEALENKRKEVEMIQISVDKSATELKHNQEKITELERKAELKEEELNLWTEHQSEIKSKERQLLLMIEDLELQEKRSDFIRKLNEKRMEELDLKEKQLEENFKWDFQSRFQKELVEKELKALESKKKGFEEEIKEFQLRKKELRESFMEFHVKNKDFLSQKKLLRDESEKLQQQKEAFERRTKQFELAEKELEESFKDVDLKKKESLLGAQLLDKESKDLEMKWREFELRIEEFSMREKVLEKSSQELQLQKQQFELAKKALEKESKHLESTRKELEETIKKFELREKELELNEKKIEGEKRLLEKDSKHLESRRKELDERIETFGLREKELGLKEKKLELGKLFEKEFKHLESRSKDLEETIKKFELREKQLELNEKKIEGEKRLLEKDSNCLESRRKELEEKIETFELREKELGLKEKLFEKDSKDLEYRRKVLEESIQKFELREKELELKQKQLVSVTHGSLKTEPVHDALSQSFSCNNVDLRFVILMMGGKDLQIFLNEHEREHPLMAEEVFKALQLSKDPAKWVLGAMEGFFRPHLRKGNVEFPGYVVRRSCMLLLQQLIRISPRIQSHVREDALKLAREWKTKLTYGCPLEVSSFLYLLGTYGLASAFDAGDIIMCLESVSKHQQNLEPELCSRLGVEEKIPSVIEDLLKSNRSIEAIKFIYGFELVECFPPVPILKNYLKHVKIHSKAMPRKKDNKENVQNESIDTRIAAMESVIRCIVEHKLESEYSPKDLENCIKQLLMQKNSKTFRGSSNCHKTRGKQKVEVKQISSTPAPSQPKAPRLAPNSSGTLRGPSHSMAIIIANMDGKNLLSFLSAYVAEHELLQSEVSAALQISNNSPKLVLNAVENLFASRLTEEEAKSCIFLLEQLMRLSPDITPDVKDAAQNVAFDWQAKLKAKNGNLFLTLAYLLLIGAYRLGSAFHKDELFNLYQRVAEKKLSPGLSHALGISEDISKAAALQSQVETRKATSESFLEKNSTVSTSVVPELAGESQCTNMDLEGKECVSVHREIPTFISLSSDPAGLILDALRKCHQSNMSKNKNAVKSFSHLLEQLMTISLKITPNVKERAYEFALDWKAKSVGLHSWEALGLLQFVASYQLSSFFSSDQLFCLLEVAYQPKKAGSFIRIFGLVEKVPGFISKLIMKKQLLLAFAYVYEFELTDMFPPVALLKQHIIYSKLVAKKIFFKGQKTTDAQYKSIGSEISALKAVVKLINRHHLQSEYSPDELRSTINKLERQRANLKASVERADAEQGVSLAREVKMLQVNNKKRPASDSTSINQAHLQPSANKFPRLVSPSEFSNCHPIQSQPQSSQYPHSSLSTSSRYYNSSVPPLVCPPQNPFLPPNHNRMFCNYVPPLMMEGNQSSCLGCHNPTHPSY